MKRLWGSNSDSPRTPHCSAWRPGGGRWKSEQFSNSEGSMRNPSRPLMVVAVGTWPRHDGKPGVKWEVRFTSESILAAMNRWDAECKQFPMSTVAMVFVPVSGRPWVSNLRGVNLALYIAAEPTATREFDGLEAELTAAVAEYEDTATTRPAAMMAPDHAQPDNVPDPTERPDMSEGPPDEVPIEITPEENGDRVSNMARGERGAE